MQNYRFLNRSEYFKVLAQRASSTASGERILIATMDFNPQESLIADLLDALNAAANRGSLVTLLVDAHNFLANERGVPGPLFYRLNMTNAWGSHAVKLDALQRLEAAGGKFQITNIPRHRFNARPVGRSHIKAAVIGDEVFIGGCNLERPWQLDVMANWRNNTAADTLADWLERAAEAPSVRAAFYDVDIETAVDNDTALLLDAGVPGQSLIYDEALRLIDEASEWLFMTCQFFPSGLTARHLATAKARGVQVDIRYSHPRAHGSAAPLQYTHQIMQHIRHSSKALREGRLDKRLPKLHAKVLISEKAALVGSHNYVPYGVMFGTAELALRSTDPAFALAARAFLLDQIHTASERSLDDASNPQQTKNRKQ